MQLCSLRRQVSDIIFINIRGVHFIAWFYNRIAYLGTWSEYTWSHTILINNNQDLGATFLIRNIFRKIYEWNISFMIIWKWKGRESRVQKKNHTLHVGLIGFLIVCDWKPNIMKNWSNVYFLGMIDTQFRRPKDLISFATSLNAWYPFTYCF